MLGFIKKTFRFMSKKDRKIRNLETMVENRNKLIDLFEQTNRANISTILELQEQITNLKNNLELITSNIKED